MPPEAVLSFAFYTAMGALELGRHQMDAVHMPLQIMFPSKSTRAGVPRTILVLAQIRLGARVGQPMHFEVVGPSEMSIALVAYEPRYAIDKDTGALLAADPSSTMLPHHRWRPMSMRTLEG